MHAGVTVASRPRLGSSHGLTTSSHKVRGGRDATRANSPKGTTRRHRTQRDVTNGVRESPWPFEGGTGRSPTLPLAVWSSSDKMVWHLDEVGLDGG